MKPFEYQRAKSPEDAVAAGGVYLAGGTSLIDLMKMGVLEAPRLVDLGRLDLRKIEADGSGLRLGALATNTAVAMHPDVKQRWPALSQALLSGASPQLRNAATVGGNLLQRTRCAYYRDVATRCNKRNPGSGCAAMDGVNRLHAVLGGSDDCIATYPGDLAAALIALDASVETRGPGGSRAMPFAELHRSPGNAPNIETVLKPGELILAIDVPAGPHTRRSHYLKIRDRQSFAFALASAAIALDLDGDAVRDVRIALGGVATVPWRAREAEASLRGKRLDEASAHAAAEIAFADAKPREHNAFKVPLGKATLVRALLETKAMEA